MSEAASRLGSELLLAPICVPVSPGCVRDLPGYVARRLSITTLDPPPAKINMGRYLLYPRESELQDQHEVNSESEQEVTLNSESVEFLAHKVPPAVEDPGPSMDRSSLSPPTTQSTSRALSSSRSVIVEDYSCKKRKVSDAHDAASKKVHNMLSSTLNEVNKLKLQLRAYDKYNQLGISRSMAAADLLEFAVITLGFYLRTAVACDIVGQKVRRDELFGPEKIFWEGDIRDLNYTSCWWWMFNGTQNTLAQYWKKKGYNGLSLSTEWHAPPRGKGRNAGAAGHTFLKEYLQRAEMDFSEAAGLTQSQVEFCIGLFLCGPKLQRNKSVHLFGLWQLVRGSKAATKKSNRHESNSTSITEQDAYDLSQAEQSCLNPKLEDFSIEQLAAKKWVLDDVLNNLGELSPYYVQHAAEVKAIGSFLFKQMGQACGRALWKIVRSSATPGVGETNDIAGTHLNWSTEYGIRDGFCFCLLCKQHDSFPVAIDAEGCWWKAVEGKWIEFQDVLKEVLIE